MAHARIVRAGGSLRGIILRIINLKGEKRINIVHHAFS
jgi:hypothetical protein